MTEDKTRLLGDWLRQRREELGVSLEQVEEDTRIRVRYLQALENEDFEALPDPAVGRGFLRNYADYLELDPQEASQRFSKLVAPPAPDPLPKREPESLETEPFRPVPLHEMPGFRSQRGLLVGVVLVVAVAALSLLAWWGYPWIRAYFVRRVPDPVTSVATATQLATSPDLATATHTATLPPATTSAPVTATAADATPTLELTITPSLTPSPSPSPSPPVYTGIFLELVFSDTSWIQVTVDGVRQFQGELEAETYRSWYGEERVELRIGNAGAVQVTINGENLGTLGGPGEVVDRIFEKLGEGIAEATFTPSVSGTVTVEATAAPAPALTPTLAPTPTVSPTVVVAPVEPITPTEAISPTATP